MSVTAQYVLHGINTPSGFLSQLSQLSTNSQMQIGRGVPAGLPGARFIYNLAQNPDFTFSCEQIKSLLDITATGMADLTAGNTDLYFKAVPNRGQRSSDASTVHLRARAAKAVMVPLSLRASNSSAASLTARMICTYDGVNEPLVPAGSLALAGTPVNGREQFTVGPAAINGVMLNGVQDVSIDFNVGLFELTADGELYVTQVAERERMPVVTIRTLTAALPTFGLNGTALSSLSVWFRKCGQTSRVSNATAEHILFTATAGLIVVPEMAGGGNQEATTTIRCELAMPDATTMPLLVNTAAAIS